MNNKVNKIDLPMVISQEIDKNKIVYLPKIPQKTLLRKEESFYNNKEKQNVGCREESFYNGKEKPLIIHPHIPCNPKRSF
jgi:hypothetical protein